MGFLDFLLSQKETRIKLQISPETSIRNFRQFTEDRDDAYMIILTSDKATFDILKLRQGRRPESYVAKATIILNNGSNELVLGFGEANLDLTWRFMLGGIFIFLVILLIYIGDLPLGLMMLFFILFTFIMGIVDFAIRTKRITNWVKDTILRYQDPEPTK